VGFDASLFVFIRGLDDRVQYTHFYREWTGWTRVPGNARTTSSPAAAVYEGRLFLALRGEHGAVRSNILSGTWRGWSEIPGAGRTTSAPAVLSYDGVLYVLARGHADRIHTSWFVHGLWSGRHELPGAGRTPSAPAAGVHGRAAASVFVRGEDDGIYVNTYDEDA
jgi:hypothetical protein